MNSSWDSAICCDPWSTTRAPPPSLSACRIWRPASQPFEQHCRSEKLCCSTVHDSDELRLRSPGFLLRLVASANHIGHSLPKGLHTALSSAACQEMWVRSEVVTFFIGMTIFPGHQKKL